MEVLEGDLQVARIQRKEADGVKHQQNRRPRDGERKTRTRNHCSKGCKTCRQLYRGKREEKDTPRLYHKLGRVRDKGMGPEEGELEGDQEEEKGMIQYTGVTGGKEDQVPVIMPAYQCLPPQHQVVWQDMGQGGKGEGKGEGKVAIWMVMQVRLHLHHGKTDTGQTISRPIWMQKMIVQ